MDLDLTYLFRSRSDESTDQTTSGGINSVGKAPKIKKGLSIRNENEANIPRASSTAPQSPFSFHFPDKPVIYSERKPKTKIKKDHVYQFIIQTQNREINLLKKQHAFFQLKHNTGHSSVPVKHQDEGSRSAFKKGHKPSMEGPSMFSPKRRRCEMNDGLTQREQYLAEVSKKNIFDTPPRTTAHSRDPSTPPSVSRPPHTHHTIFDDQKQKAPASASRPPKPRATGVAVEELCEHHHHYTIPSTPPTAAKSQHHPQPRPQQQHQQQYHSPSNDHTQRMSRGIPPSSLPKPPVHQPSTANVTATATAKRDQQSQLPQHPSQSSNNSLEELLNRLKELETEVHSMHLTDPMGGEPAPSPFIHHAANSTTTTTSTASHTQKKNMSSKKSSPAKFIPSSSDSRHDSTAPVFIYESPPSSPPRPSRPRKAQTSSTTGEKERRMSSENETETETETEKDTGKDRVRDRFRTTDHPSPTATQHTETPAVTTALPSATIYTTTHPDSTREGGDNTTPVPSTFSAASEEEFKTFCLQLSQAASPAEVQHILHEKHTSSSTSTNPNTDPPSDANRPLPHLTPSTSYTHTHTVPLTSPAITHPSHTYTHTPLSVTTLLSPLGSQGSGTSSKVALSELATYQSKLSSWRKRYPTAGGASGN